MMVVAKYLRTGFSSSWIVQLPLVVEENIMLLPVTLLLA